MNLTKIKSISLSLMKRETDINEGKAEYTKQKTAKFIIPKNFFKKTNEEEVLKTLISSMFNDLKSNSISNSDSLGIWVEYKSITLENAISLRTLEDIQEYSKEPTDSLYEFFKMTIME